MERAFLGLKKRRNTIGPTSPISLYDNDIVREGSKLDFGQRNGCIDSYLGYGPIQIVLGASPGILSLQEDASFDAVEPTGTRNIFDIVAGLTIQYVYSTLYFFFFWMSWQAFWIVWFIKSVIFVYDSSVLGWSRSSKQGKKRNRQNRAE